MTRENYVQDGVRAAACLTQLKYGRYRGFVVPNPNFVTPPPCSSCMKPGPRRFGYRGCSAAGPSFGPEPAAFSDPLPGRRMARCKPGTSESGCTNRTFRPYSLRTNASVRRRCIPECPNGKLCDSLDKGEGKTHEQISIQNIILGFDCAPRTGFTDRCLGTGHHWVLHQRRPRRRGRGGCRGRFGGSVQ